MALYTQHTRQGGRVGGVHSRERFASTSAGSYPWELQSLATPPASVEALALTSLPPSSSLGHAHILRNRKLARTQAPAFPIGHHFVNENSRGRGCAGSLAGSRFHSDTLLVAPTFTPNFRKPPVSLSLRPACSPCNSELVPPGPPDPSPKWTGAGAGKAGNQCSAGPALALAFAFGYPLLLQTSSDSGQAVALLLVSCPEACPPASKV